SHHCWCRRRSAFGWSHRCSHVAARARCSDSIEAQRARFAFIDGPNAGRNSRGHIGDWGSGRKKRRASRRGDSGYIRRDDSPKIGRLPPKTVRSSTCRKVAKVKTVISTDRAAAVELLRKGEIVALPTETVYGLAADALKPIAVAKIFEAKDRPRFDPLIVHL